MSNNPMNNNTKKKPSKYGWIFYAAILIFVAFNLFGGLALNNQEKTTTSQLEEYLREGDVDKIVIITNTRQAKVYLNDTALQKEVHKKVAEPSLLPSAAPTAQYVLDFGDLQNFENTIKTIKSENNLATVIDYDKENT